MVLEILGCKDKYYCVLHATRFVVSVIWIWSLKCMILLFYHELDFFFSWNYGFAHLFVPITGTGEAKTDWFCGSTS